MASERNIKARRLLSDLFKVGTEIRFWAGEDGKPTGKIGPFENDQGKRIPLKDMEVAMFVRPPDPLQRDMSIRAGQGRRAAALVRAKRDADSEEHLTVMAFIADMSDETLIDYVIQGDHALRIQEAEREILALDEWKDMGSFQEAMRLFLDKNEEDLAGDEEYEALLDLDDKYGEQVRNREQELSDAQREALRIIPREQVEKKALDKRAEIVGSQAFMHEYEKQMLFYSTRDPDAIEKLFFADADELAGQPDQVRELIEEALIPYITDEGEAKNLQGAVSGSDSSELPDSPATSDTSTPKVPSE